jgi:DNA-binding response OmpR family regulator
MTQPVAFIVEDDEQLSLVFTHALQEAGYATEIFFEGQNVLTRLSEFKPYIVILDLHLPNVSGAKILNYIRAEEKLKDVRVIITSADAGLSTDPEIENKADFVLIKPVRFSQLQLLAKRLFPTEN